MDMKQIGIVETGEAITTVKPGDFVICTIYSWLGIARLSCWIWWFLWQSYWNNLGGNFQVEYLRFHANLALVKINLQIIAKACLSLLTLADMPRWPVTARVANVQKATKLSLLGRVAVNVLSL